MCTHAQNMSKSVAYRAKIALTSHKYFLQGTPVSKSAGHCHRHVKKCSKKVTNVEMYNDIFNVSKIGYNLPNQEGLVKSWVR